ncbi:hypothetical protein IJT17_06080 [bacterium]|nr:hypothetical protein [bacterium]
MSFSLLSHNRLRLEFKSIALYGLCVLIFLSVAELYLRVKGYSPESSVQEKILKLDQYRPGYGLYHPYIGWTNTPGRKVKDYEFALDRPIYNTIWINGARASRPCVQSERKKKVLLLGCSFAYGMGVEDNETFAWLLNQHFTDISFDNYGVPAYSTYQCLQREREILQSQHYDLVLYVSIMDHFRRNRYPVFLMASYELSLGKLFSDDGQYNNKSDEDLSFGELLKREHPVWCYPCTYLSRTGRLMEFIPTRQRWLFDNHLAFSKLLKRVYNYSDYHRYAEENRYCYVNNETYKLYWILVHRMWRLAAQYGCDFAVINLVNKDENTMALDYPTPQDLARIDPYGRECLPNKPSFYCVFATDGREYEQDSPKFHVGGDMTLHPNHLVHKNWAKHIGAWIEYWDTSRNLESRKASS